VDGDDLFKERISYPYTVIYGWPAAEHHEDRRPPARGEGRQPADWRVQLFFATDHGHALTREVREPRRRGDRRALGLL